MKTTQELRIAASKRDHKGLDVRELPLLPRRKKCFLLTSPFIELALSLQALKQHSFHFIVHCVNDSP